MTDDRHGAWLQRIRTPRIAGSALSLMGLAFVYFFDVRPLLAARAGEAEVTLVMKGAVLGPALLLIGLGLLTVGPERMGFEPPANKPNRRGWVVIGAIMAASMAIYFRLKIAIEALGYRFDR